MSIAPLPSSTARRLEAAYAVRSFEAAVQQVLQHCIHYGPTVVDVTVHAQALRFTIRDNRTQHSQQYLDSLLPTHNKQTSTNQSVNHPHSNPLPALAATSTVELRVRSPSFAAIHVVHAATTLERRFASESDRRAILPRDGVQIDVWQTFSALPVRRQIELSRSVQSLTQAVRNVVVAIALANPSVSLTLYASNNLVLFRAPAENRLSLARVHAAFADTALHHWTPVLPSRHPRLRVSGFVATTGLPHSRLQLLAVDGVPSACEAVHAAVQHAWRHHFCRDDAVETPYRRHAAYVINCRFVHDERRDPRIPRSPAVLADRDVQSIVSRAVLAALRKPAPHGPLTRSTVDPRLGAGDAERVCPRPSSSDASLPSETGKKRPRFVDAVVVPVKRRPPSSAWSVPSNESLEPVLRISRDSTVQGDVSSRMATQKLFARGLSLNSAPTQNTRNFSSRCISTRPQPSPSGCFSRGDADTTSEFFNNTRISIERESIKSFRVVGQVERKFIVVMDNKNTMYAIDQHAASERLLYERNLRETKKENVMSWTLPRSKKVSVSEEQMAVAEEQRALLGKWGWTVGLREGETTIEMVQVPRLCKLSGCDDITLRDSEHLRSFLDSLLDGAARAGLPRPFNDAIASAACHTAVRFGDILSKSQCVTLVKSLAQCENPFVCAHGRPSIVPLVMLYEQ